jgi:putative copper export protein
MKLSGIILFNLKYYNTVEIKKRLRVENWFIHFHLFAAIAWIGGSIFMFVLGVSLRDKEKQRAVYPHIGPIFGYFELVALIVLVISGLVMIENDGLLDLLFTNDTSEVVEYLILKLLLVATLIIATAIHFYIAYKTNDRERTKIENFLSRGTSMYIFFVNLFIMHYAILIRTIMS